MARALAQITPRSGRSIEPSKNNKGQLADYAFYFELEGDTVADYYLFIKFPESDFPGIPASAACSAFLIDSAKSALTCQTNSSKWLKIGFANISARKGKVLSVLVKGIQNPASEFQGIGNFKLELRKGDFNVQAFNHMFGSLAFAPSPLSLASLSFAVIGSKVVNRLSTYKLIVTLNPLATTLKANSRITVKFPAFYAGSDLLKVSIVSQQSLLSSWDQETSQLEISGISEQANVGTFEIVLDNMTNPSFATPSGQITLILWQRFVNTMEQTLTISDTDNFLPDDFLQTKVTNFGLYSYVLSKSDEVFFEISLRAPNGISQGAIVQFAFSVDFGLVGGCWPLDGFKGISEAQPVSCTVAGKTLKVQSFKEIGAYARFSFGARVINPSAVGQTQKQVISVFDNAVNMRLLYSSNSLDFNVQNSLVFSQLGISTVTLPANSLTSLQIDFKAPINLSSASTLKFTVTFLKENFYPVNNIKCEFVIDNVLKAANSCLITKNAIYSAAELSISGFTFTQNVLQSLKITPLDASSGIQTPVFAGTYALEVKIESSNNLENFRGTVIFAATPFALDPTKLSIVPTTLDYEKTTPYFISFYLPFALPSGYWSDAENLSNSVIELSFPTNLLPQPLFKSYLGFDSTYSADITKPSAQVPCFGSQNLLSSDPENPNFLRCVAYFPDALHPLATRIKIDNFVEIIKAGQIALFIPNILNPKSITQAAQIAVKVYSLQKGQLVVVLTGTLTLPVMKAHNIFANPNNSNGPLGVPTNQKPKYFPSVINSNAVLEIKVVPSLALAQNDGMLVTLPFLPATQPAGFLLPAFHKSNCTMSQQPATCFSFREAGQILVYFSQPFTANIEITFEVYNCKTPPFVSNIQSNNLITTFTKTFAEVEEIVVLPIDAFDWGKLLFSKIRPRFYEALQINVQYEWVFIVSNPIPEGGYVTLYFPSNYYDLESSVPCPQIELREGLRYKDPAPGFISDCTLVYKSAIVTINNIQKLDVSSEGFNKTLSVVWINGVKNPSQSGWTPYFGVTTHNQEGFVIDRDLEIPIIYIDRLLAGGKITFSTFHCSPDNGKLLSNYLLEFYIETSIPKFGLIKIWFPSTEFSPGFSEENECVVGGALSTILKCEFDNVFPLITITLDEDLKIRPGMAPVSLYFPKIRNFNADLSSGLVKVTTFYDGTILDDSGQEETNRKAVTKREAAALQINSADVLPLNAGAVSTITISFSVSHNVYNTSFIEVHFPTTFVRGLGQSVNCTSPDLLIGVNDPVNCTAVNYKLLIQNIRPNASCPCTFSLSIRGVVLPNFEFRNNIGKTRMFFFDDPNHVGSFSDNILNLNLIQAPIPLAWDSASFLSAETAVWSQLRLTFSCPMAASFDTVQLSLAKDSFPDVMNFAASLAVGNGNAEPVSFVSNFLQKKLQASVALNPGSLQELTLNGVLTSFSLTDNDFPTLSLVQNAGMVCQSYANLIPQAPFKFAKVNNRVLLDIEDEVTIIGGTFSSVIKLKADKAANQLTKFEPISLHNFTSIEEAILQAGSLEAGLRVGSPRSLLNRETYFYLRPNSSSFYYSRPYKVFVDNQNSAYLKIDSLASIVAGGFLGPVNVSLEFAPFELLSVSIVVAGSSNSSMAVYPSQLNFTSNDTVLQFYIFSYFSSKFSSAKIFFSLSGPNAEVFSFVNQKNRLDLGVVNGKETAPVLLDARHRVVRRGELEFSLAVDLQLDSNCVVYYALLPRGSADISFVEVLNKALKFRFFSGDYFFGMAFTNSLNFTAHFEIFNITEENDFKLKMFFLNTDGVVGLADFVYFSTRFLQLPFFLIFEYADSSALSASNPENDIIRLLNSTNLILNYTFSNSTNSSYFQENFTIDGKNYTFENDSFALLPQILTPEITEDPEEAFYDKYSEILKEASSYQTDEDFNPLTEVIENVEINYAEDLNSQNEFLNSMPDNVNMGYALDVFKVISQNITNFKNTPLKLMKEGDYFAKSQRYYVSFEDDGLFMKIQTTMSLVNNKKFKMLVFWPTAQFNQTNEGLIFDLEKAFNDTFSQNSSLKNFYYYLPRLKKMEFSDKNFPYIRKITNSSIEIGGLALKSPAVLDYIAIFPIRTDFKQNLTQMSAFPYFDSQNMLDDNCERQSNSFLQLKCYAEINRNLTLDNQTQYQVQNFTKLFELPTASQISRKLDPNNFRAISFGSFNLTTVENYTTIEINDLIPGTNYTIFLSLRGNGTLFPLEIDQNEIVSFTFKAKLMGEVSTGKLLELISFLAILFLLI